MFILLPPFLLNVVLATQLKNSKTPGGLGLRMSPVSQVSSLVPPPKVDSRLLHLTTLGVGGVDR